jgi:hypothetical protein
MSRAEQQVAKEIVEALQARIAGWQAELQKIEVLRARQDRKVARYQVLTDLIAAAQAEIATASSKLPVERVTAGDR